MPFTQWETSKGEQWQGGFYKNSNNWQRVSSNVWARSGRLQLQTLPLPRAMHSQDDQELDQKWPMVPPAAVQRKVTVKTLERPSSWLFKRQFESTHLPTSSDEEVVKCARLLPSRTSTPSQKWQCCQAPSCDVRNRPGLSHYHQGNPLKVERRDQQPHCI